MNINGVKFDAVWKYDTQDKYDFDFVVVKVLTRYWSRDNTAKPSIYLGDKEIVECDHYIQGENEYETRFLTEQWIEENLIKIIDKLQE